MKTSRLLIGVMAVILMVGCATKPPEKKVVVWETAEIPRSHEILGPVSVREEVAESASETIQGLADFVSKDGRVSDRMPEDMKMALEMKRDAYKEMIFEKLAEKAKEYDADAVIGAEYVYVPPFATFSTKALVSAKGTMVKYKK